MKTDTFFVARPTLAADLIAQGFTYRMTLNPWDTTLDAWAFDFSRELARAVIEYYRDIGRDAPGVIYRYLKEIEKSSTQ